MVEFFLMLFTLFFYYGQRKPGPQHAYSGQTDNPTPKDLLIHCPFDIVIDPMQRLLLINFEKDPDRLYVGFEPQVFDDPVYGKGMLVIGWRNDGKVDVYHDPGLIIRPEKYDIAGKGLAHQVQREMKNNFFRISEKGVQANIRFKDLQGRDVTLQIEEESSQKRYPFSLLAPMGDAAENPSSLPLVLLHDFYFVRRHKTSIHIQINGRIHKPDKLPFPIDGQFVYFTRYCPDPTIATINPAFEGKLSMAVIRGKKAQMGELQMEVDNKNLNRHIKSISRNYKDRRVCLTFDPPFPDLFGLENNETVNGCFSITEDPAVGMIKGNYILEKTAEGIKIEMVPVNGWIPSEKKFSLKVLYRIARIFKKWPTSYRWIANINPAGNDGMLMKSRWERIKS